MDALTFDQMHSEYQEAKEEVIQVVSELHSGHTYSVNESANKQDSNQDASHTIAEDITSSATVPVSELGSEAYPGIASGAENNLPASVNSSSSNSSSFESNKPSATTGSNSLYQPGFTAPTITYEKDNENQKLIAVIGREFDCPHNVSMSLQKLTSKQPNSGIPVGKFVPYTLKRKMLLRGSFDSRELKKHDLICMCYNASEARLLLTGVDGFYSSLLKHVEACLGTNKIAFLISNYSAPHTTVLPPTTTDSLIHPTLRTRLYNQEPLRCYLEEDHVISWSDGPNKLQAERLVELASMEANPQSILANASCTLL